jgi:hypothetical protein
MVVGKKKEKRGNKSVEIEAYLKPSWVLALTKINSMSIAYSMHFVMA